jgi:hypothetical protein
VRKTWLLIGLACVLSISSAVVWIYNLSKQSGEGAKEQTAYTEQVYEAYTVELQKLIEDYELQLEQYHLILRQQAESDFEEQLAASEAEFAVNVEAYLAQLESESAELADKLRQRYELPILNAQLRLAIVNLSESERVQLEEQLSEMRAEYAVMRSEYEQELNQKLEVFKESEEKRQKEKLLAFEESNAEKLGRMFEQYKQRLDAELAAKKQKLEADMRRAAAVRE